MLAAMEEILCELSDHEKRTKEQGLPPGFRFHPTDEELITFYLASKVFHDTSFTSNLNFAEVDLNRCEPWQLPEVAKMGEREWYLFSLRDRKYPTGLRTNRATGAGYWKATGKDKEIYSTTASNGGGTSQQLLGMKKTLVFYKGRAPRGVKTKWVMHEYRLLGDPPFSTLSSKEEWVICRIFHKCGEKRNPLLQFQGHFGLSSSTTSESCVPPPLLLGSPNSITLEQQEEQNDHLFLPLHHALIQPSLPNPASTVSASDQEITNPKNLPFGELCFKQYSNLLQQNYSLKVIKEESASKIGKMEGTNYKYQRLENGTNNNMRWIDTDHQNSRNMQNSYLPTLEMDAGLWGANAEIRDMFGTSTGFNNSLVGLQEIILDSPIGIDSWARAQAQHV